VWRNLCGTGGSSNSPANVKSFCSLIRHRSVCTDSEWDLLNAKILPANKTPFTDDEINRILAACDKFKREREPQPGYRQTSGEDIKDFIYVMLYTGMRISDVATFD
jgi:integrase